MRVPRSARELRDHKATPTRLFASMAHGKDSGFSYEHQEKWKDLKGCFADGNRQSPIDIQEKNAKIDDKWKTLYFHGWDSKVKGTLTNNGHSIKFTPSCKEAEFTDPRGVTYELQGFHFHWGENDCEGSEHCINGEQYSAEIHFVHKKRGGAETDIDYLSVVGVLCQPREASSTSTVWEYLNLKVPVKYGEKPVEVTVVYGDLMPAGCRTETSSYFRYEGSLTTPPCTEVVQWLVLKDQTFIPEPFLAKLRNVEDSTGSKIGHNFRKLQLVNAREVVKTCM